MADRRQLNLNLFIYPGGHHEAAWRYKDSEPERIGEIGYYQDLARAAEAAKFDAVFFADGPSLAENVRYASRYRLEPLTTITAMSVVTERVGFIATASTSYFDPYNLARLFASVDHISHGRVGWNIVTTGDAKAALNFGLDSHPVHAERYERAHEFVDVVTKLFDSWEDDALVVDKASGLFADTDKIHEINHVGKAFRVKGPLNLPRGPQGRPVYVQAGSSEDGRAFAATHAEAIFTAHQRYEDARDFYADIKKRTKANGRRPEQLKVLPGISPFIGSTEKEAQDLHDEFNALTQPEYSIQMLKRLTDLDLSGYDLDGPFPRHLIDASGERGVHSRFQVVLGIIDRDKPTIRQLLHRLAGARGHWVLTGTPEKIADNIQHWFENGAADGFNVMPPWLNGGFDAFVEHVVPILRKRGLFREEYSASTLRGHYGLERPESRYSYPQRASA